MKKVFPIIICFIFLTGCWDRKELNERAIWMATGWDAAEDGGVEISGQIVIPANVQTQGGGGGATGQGFFTISAKGKNVRDALQNMQAKLPREAFFGQRRVIFLGEEFAKRGVKDQLDINSRSSDVSLRADLFVIKGGTAKEIMTLANPLEKSPIIATLKEHRESGGRGDKAHLNFLIAANRDGIRPSIPTIEISKSLEGKPSGKENSPNPKLLRLAGLSVFDKQLKMKGFLNTEENRNILWVMGFLEKMTITLKDGDGSKSIDLRKIRSKMEPTFDKNGKPHFTVTLTGDGSLTESNSGLDVSYSDNLRHLEKAFAKQAQAQVQQTINKVQKEYGLDIFGFGEALHQHHPDRWKRLKTNWDQTFAETTITVHAKIKVKQIGMSGPSLLYKESEINK
jgi:spore germination protein KC